MHNSSRETFIKLMKELGNSLWWIVISFVLAALTVVLTLYIPVLFGNSIDLMLYTPVDWVQLKGILLKVCVLIVVCAILTWIMNVVNNKVAYGVIRQLRSKAIRKIQQVPLKYVDSQSSGDIVQRVIADVDQISDGLLLGLTQLFTGIVTIIVTLYFMVQKSVLITLLVLVLTPVSFLVAKFISSRSYTLFGKQSSTRGKQTALIEEMIGNQKVVKAFGYEKTAGKRFETINTELQKYSQQATFYSSITNPSTRFVNSIIYALVALAGAFSILKGNLSVGGLTVLLTYANQYMKPFNDISSVITELQNALACADRVFELIEQPVEVLEGKKVLRNVQGKVDLEHVNFSYVPQTPLIQNFTLHAKPGTHVAIVGPTGCGKTTCINLLMRFYDVDSGTICLDDTNIYDLTRHALRENYGMVLQESWLKKASIKENIRLGKQDATEEQIIQAAKATHAWEFIKRLPDGLESIVDEDALSQGQKQLLCITRVMLALPPVLILDEATSSIDTRTEVQIQKAFDTLMEGRTSFVVAHRLSTIRNADVILVMDHGNIIEQGNHEELMAKNGFYTHLYTSQFERTA
ncbi:MAG: ABC transporter ATP-binding protein [Bulleidia sp.]|nr:ABC transporter ATP-binding protein [Bulleidia sp.]